MNKKEFKEIFPGLIAVFIVYSLLVGFWWWVLGWLGVLFFIGQLTIYIMYLPRIQAYEEIKKRRKEEQV